MKRLQQMIERAYTLSAQALNGDQINLALAEEVSGECAEFLAMMNGDWSVFESEEVVDDELLDTVKTIQSYALLDRATTLLYNMEGNAYQAAYEHLETALNELKQSLE